MILAALLLQAAVAPPRPVMGRPSDDPAFNGPDACSGEEIENGTRVFVYLGDRSCVKFKPARRFVGLWINAFEGQNFIEGGRAIRDIRGSNSDVWFSTDGQTRHDEVPPCPHQHACRITFDGREAVDMHRLGVFAGYGHMGASAGLVLADRILSVEDLGPL